MPTPPGVRANHPHNDTQAQCPATLQYQGQLYSCSRPANDEHIYHINSTIGDWTDKTPGANLFPASTPSQSQSQSPSLKDWLDPDEQLTEAEIRERMRAEGWQPLTVTTAPAPEDLVQLQRAAQLLIRMSQHPLAEQMTEQNAFLLALNAYLPYPDAAQMAEKARARIASQQSDLDAALTLLGIE